MAGTLGYEEDTTFTSGDTELDNLLEALENGVVFTEEDD